MKAYKLNDYQISVPRYGKALILMMEYLSELSYSVGIGVVLNPKHGTFIIEFRTIKPNHFDVMLDYINANL
jgi:hypothetical protein